MRGRLARRVREAVRGNGLAARPVPRPGPTLQRCALLGDLDGVYDPAEHNDQLLLGLKGTISEAELHLIRQRMWSGRIAKARRGELAVPLPAGLARRSSGEVGLDPDGQVRSVVRLVFDLFERLGTIGAVLGFLADNRIQLGVRLCEGPERGELAWRRPSRITVANMLRNPAYAGIYAYGHSTLDPRRRQPGRPCTGRIRLGRDDWLVSCPGCCPPISASSSTSGTFSVWRPTGPARRAWARCATARPCWPGWWPAAAR